MPLSITFKAGVTLGTHAACIRSYAFGQYWNTLVSVVIYEYL